MSLETKIVALAQAIGADVKALRLAQGDLMSLTTTTKTSLVAAINELALLVGGSGGAGIDDAAVSGGAVTWSVDKITSSITAARNALKDELLGGAGAALDTLAELAAALGNNPNFATTIATELGNRVRYDAAQSLTTAQKTQACTNIGAVELTAIGDPERDLAAVYAAAKV